MDEQLTFIETVDKSYFEKMGYECKEYNNGKQLNVTDKSGVIQTFYPTTGTIVLHAANDRNDHRIKSLRDQNVEVFIRLLNNPQEIQKFWS